MSKRRQFEIEASPSNFAFDVEGDFFPRAELVHNEGTEAPTVAEVRYSWEVSGSIKAADLTENTTWDDFNAFVAIVAARTAPTYVRIVRDPSGDAEEVWRLDGTTYEQLRIEEFEVSPNEELPGGRESHWVTHAHVRLRMSAVRKFADANGIAGWDQRTIYTVRNGLRSIEWRTKVTTAGGASPVSAEDKARLFAAIDVTTLGDSTWAYQTGNSVTDGGVDLEVIDADERSGSRVPTVVEAVCRVAQQGITVGASGPGTAPGSIVKRTEINTTATETETITTAEVTGPNAETAGLALKPAGELSESSQITGTDNTFSGRWVRKTTRDSTSGSSRTIKVEISGGKPVKRFTVISGGHEPIEQTGGLLPFTCKTSIVVRKTGIAGTNAELPLPPLLPAPWVLDPLKSVEGSPVVDGDQASAFSQNKWVREAVLVYMAARPPARSPVSVLNDSTDSVASYFLPGAG